MNPSFLDKMRTELLRRRDELIRHLVSDAEGSRLIVEDDDPKDIVDQAADDVHQKNLDALNAVEAQTLQRIDQALARLQNNRYGICMECSQPIAEARLEALPYALFCIGCQSRRDRKNR